MHHPDVSVVDDEQSIADALAHALRDEGYAARAAYLGIAALEETDARAPDLVVADVTMPGIDGITLGRRLRERGIPVLLTSAVRHGAPLPGVRCLPKPFDLDDFPEAVTRALGQTR